MPRHLKALFVATIASCFLSACQQPAAPSIAAEDTQLTLKQGAIIGSRNALGGKQWQGIPYAEPPLAELRWRAPQGKKPWDTRLNALQHSQACVQGSGGTGSTVDTETGVGGSEDCLYLNVYAPENAQNLPVMLWVHGGSNTHGSANIYDGSRLAVDNQVIVVTINYRLGALGWFKHPALAEAGNVDASGNFGTLDIIQSLKWVQQNIQVFGGNKDNVTLFGESAGGFDTLSLMLSPMAKGLFHKAIVESGGLWFDDIDKASNFRDEIPKGSRYSAQEIELILHQQDGSAVDRAAAKQLVSQQNHAERAQYLRAKSKQEFYQAYRFYGEEKPDIPVVFQDGLVISTGDPLLRFQQPEQYNNVPLIIGTNRDEIKLYYYDNPKYVDILWGKIPSMKNPDYYNARAQYHSERWKYTGADSIAEAITQGLEANNKENTVWAYRFDWDEQARPLWVKLDQLLGASHGMEIPFVFGFTDSGGLFDPMINDENSPGRESLSHTMRAYWSQLAKSGQPNKTNQPNWPNWQAGDSETKYLVLDTEADAGIRMSSATVDPGSFVERIKSDQRLPSAQEKCEVYASLVAENEKLWPAAAYQEHKIIDCQAYPLELRD